MLVYQRVVGTGHSCSFLVRGKMNWQIPSTLYVSYPYRPLLLSKAAHVFQSPISMDGPEIGEHF